jgi:hypothetical protein
VINPGGGEEVIAVVEATPVVAVADKAIAALSPITPKSNRTREDP